MTTADLTKGEPKDMAKAEVSRYGRLVLYGTVKICNFPEALREEVSSWVARETARIAVGEDEVAGGEW